MSQKIEFQKQTNNSVNWIYSLLLCVVAIAVALLIYDRFFTSYDDGIAAEGARLVLHGKVPYRDFWALYAPGSFYANALFFKMFGESFLSFRLALLFLVAIQAFFLHGIIWRVVQNRFAGILAAIGYIAFIPVGIPVTCPLSYWLTFVLFSAYCLVRWVHTPLPRWEYLCGFSLGIGTLFRQDGGLYFTAVVLPLVFISAPRIGAKRIMAIFRVALSFGLVIGSVLTYYAMNGALIPMYDDTIRFALTKFPHSREVPYPIPWHKALIMAKYYAPISVGFIYRLAAFWLLPAILALLAIVSVYRLLKSDISRNDMCIAMLSCIAFVLFAMVSVRPVGMRISGAVILSLIVFAGFISDRARSLKLISWGMLVLSVFAYSAYGIAELRGQRQYGTAPITVKGGVMAGKGYAEIISDISLYVKEHTTPGEKILSGTPAIYFTTGRDPATKYYEPHPCLTDTVQIQREIISDIKRENVRYFIRSAEWERDGYFTIERKNQPRKLINYIKSNYKMVLDGGVLDVYKRIH